MLLRISLSFKNPRVMLQVCTTSWRRQSATPTLPVPT